MAQGKTSCCHFWNRKQRLLFVNWWFNRSNNVYINETFTSLPVISKPKQCFEGQYIGKMDKLQEICQLQELYPPGYVHLFYPYKAGFHTRIQMQGNGVCKPFGDLFKRKKVEIK